MNPGFKKKKVGRMQQMWPAFQLYHGEVGCKVLSEMQGACGTRREVSREQARGGTSVMVTRTDGFLPPISAPRLLLYLLLYPSSCEGQLCRVPGSAGDSGLAPCSAPPRSLLLLQQPPKGCSCTK